MHVMSIATCEEYDSSYLKGDSDQNSLEAHDYIHLINKYVIVL